MGERIKKITDKAREIGDLLSNYGHHIQHPGEEEERERIKKLRKFLREAKKENL